MKTILVAVVGTVGLLATPAVAGTLKSKSEPKAAKAVVVAEANAVKSADVAKPDAGLTAAVEGAVGAEVAAAAVSPEILAIPELPADPSNALTPFANLETRVALPSPLKISKPATKAKAPVMKFGNDYVIGTKRTAARPTEEVQQIVPKGLSQAQITTFVQAHSDDVQLCWNRLPASQRSEAATVVLKLSISDAGNVTDIELGGDVPAGAHKCMVGAVSRWQFPTAEIASDIEYGISLRSL